MSVRSLLMAAATTGPAVGEAVYNTAGTHSWVCPAGVTSVSVVCVGHGGRGGGGLGWKNDIAVTPGQSYSVVIGGQGQDTYFISTATVAGYPGGAVSGGTYTGTSGGNGGGLPGNSNAYGGGGAAGYSGNGGVGGYSTVSGGNASGGGGGGGAGNSEGYYPGGGGGVGLYGQGSNGAGGSWSSGTAFGGGGGSGGSIGGNGTQFATATGGSYGGGGSTLATGGPAAVRIIWGPGRSFPSNAA